MEKKEIGRQEGSREEGVGRNVGPHEVKTSSREGSGALHRVERPISVRCGRIDKNIHHHAHHRNSGKLDDTDRAEERK